MGKRIDEMDDGIFPVMGSKNKKSQVLIVEDSHVCADILQAMLKHSEHDVDVHWCVTLQDALKKMQSMKYDLVFLDVNLPDGKGYDLIPFLRGSQPDAACVMLSGDFVDQMHTDLQDSNVYALLKPPNFSKLRDIFSRHLS